MEMSTGSGNRGAWSLGRWLTFPEVVVGSRPTERVENRGGNVPTLLPSGERPLGWRGPAVDEEPTMQLSSRCSKLRLMNTTE
ncbi:hypothetical protein NDU88_006000 [Pleurodeles waltl]|uniref:Uncharacterized protein n=1 Tax=Pleurodeles waltl TaxID=8319 RepID=A0AAV7SNJ7_PLEWA|nr:hypothetical protein NDU88_006000 [Pleurodeles waltl]